MESAARTDVLQAEMQAFVRRTAESIAATPEIPALTLLQQLIEPLAAAALVADNHGRFVAVNAPAAALTGYSTQELMRLSVWQITPGLNEHEAETLWRAFRQQREQYGQYKLLTKSGQVVDAEYAARTDVLRGFHLSLLRLPTRSRL